MKKFLILAAAATMMVSCMQTEKLNDDLRIADVPRVIGFNTISEKATKATVENLEDYHRTFAVWSTKKSNNDENAPAEVVFCGDSLQDIITYDDDKMAPNHWTYSPYRYWDKQATYDFVAVSPNADIIRFNSPDDVADNGGTFITVDTINGYTLIGQNLQTSAAPGVSEMKIGFKGGENEDTDLMTSKKETVNGANPVPDVNMEFKHILAKLNISIAKDPTFDNVKVIIDSVKVVGLDDSGFYFEATSNTNSNWRSSLKNAGYKLMWKNNSGFELPNSVEQGDKHVAQPRYFIESLVMPQPIDQNVEKVIVDYRIVSTNKNNEVRTEKYNYVLKLDDSETRVKVFGANNNYFLEKNNYTIKLTVKPNIITFDASTEVWTNKTGEGTIVPPAQN